MHKLHLLILLLIVGPSICSSQNIIFSESFSSTTIPSTFTVEKADTGIPETDVSDFTDAWITIQIGNNRMAASTSWYQDNGSGIPQADNWLISKKYSISQLATLTWDARALDASFPDGYEVYILDGVGVSNPGSGDFLTNGMLAFSLSDPPSGSGENANWTSRSIDLFSLGFTNTEIFIAWRNNSTNEYILAIDNIQLTDYFNIDSRTSNLLSPKANSCQLSSNENITIEIENYGINPLDSVLMSYSLDLSSPVSEMAVFNPPLNIFEKNTFTFATTIDLSQDELYSLDIWSELNADGNIKNDTISEIIGSAEPTTVSSSDPYITGFELLDLNDLKSWAWTFDNVDMNGDGFGVFQAGFAHDGLFALVAQSGNSISENDWAFSTCIDLTGGQGYSINYMHRTGVSSNGNPIREKFRIAAGTAPHPDSMTILIEDSVGLSDFERYATAFQPTVDGIYYVGINRITSQSTGPGSPFLYIIDEFKVEELLSPTAAFSLILGTQDSSISISNNSLGDGNSYVWYWGNGDSSTLENPLTYQYDDTGTFDVCLSATNFAGNDQTCQTVVINAVTEPQADFDLQINGLEITVTDQSKGNVNSWSWDFGDGTTGAGPGPLQHTYAAGGTYIVCLNVTNILGTDSTCDTFALTSVQDIDFASSYISVSPNPTEGKIVISGDRDMMKNKEIKLFDLNGRLVLQKSVPEYYKESIELSLEDIDVGTYLLRVGKSHIRIIKI